MERVGFSIAFTAMAKQAGLSEALKGTVLSAFFWGYAVSQARPATPTSLRLKSTVNTGRTCHREAALSNRAHCNQVPRRTGGWAAQCGPLRVSCYWSVLRR